MTPTCTAKRTSNPFLRSVLAGLSQPQKQLCPQYFYDAAGSRLFDRITQLDEYYLARTELGILRAHAAAMADRLGPKCLVVEPGAGSLVKVRRLLDALERPAGYVPIDVSGDHLRTAVEELTLAYPTLAVFPVVADFTNHFEFPSIAANRRVVYFPGSTLGNFDPIDADALLCRLARIAGRGGGLLLGVDLQKDAGVLEPAYDDAHGVTAAFNRNLLVRINREIGADFDPSAFRHRAFYNRRQSRIEMHLVSALNQRVIVAGCEFTFRAGESIHTESSYKYDLTELARRAGRCGLHVEQCWTDERDWFAVLYLSVER